MSRYEDIKEELKNNYEDIKNSPDPEGLVMEYAVSWIPVYYNDIINEWHKDMPNDFTDSWQELGHSKDNITALMAIDLDFWYSDMGTRAWQELEEELGETNE